MRQAGNRGPLTGGLILALLAIAPAHGQAPVVPLGDDFGANATPGAIHSGLGVFRDGSFVVAWMHEESTDVVDTRARRFAADGTPGGEFEVHGNQTTNDNYRPEVAANRLGDFVVTWNVGSSENGVWARRFASDGSSTASQEVLGFFGDDPSVAQRDDGSFLVVWHAWQGGVLEIFGRRYASDGTPFGEPFVVTTGGSGGFPAVASAGDHYVVVWHSLPGPDVVGQRLAADGTPVGGVFPINTYLTGSQSMPAVAGERDGGFVVVWTSPHDGSGFGTFGRRFAADGTPATPELAVNAITFGSQYEARVASVGGSFLVVWRNSDFGGAGTDVHGRLFTNRGQPLSGDFLVSSATTGLQSEPSVGAGDAGRVVVAWRNGFDTSARRFIVDPIFADGFESGDLGGWTEADTDEGDLTVVTPGLVGTHGLAALLDDLGAQFVVDDSPASEVRYRVRFYLDPNGYTVGADGTRLKLLTAFSEEPDRLRLLTVVMRRLGGEILLLAKTRRDDGSWLKTAFVPITDAPHAVELDWQRATAPGAADGRVELFVDGGLVAVVSGVDNDSRAIDSVRLGVLGINPGDAGTVLLDAFESRRLTAIGP